MKLKKLHQRGDTIVEVLIAIAVASAVLGSAFVVVNRTSKNVRQSQEHVEALKLVEGQVELMRERRKSQPLPTTVGCLDASNPSSVTDPAGYLPTSNVKCKVNPNGTSYTYDLEIVPGTPRGDGGVDFVFRATWEGATGSAQKDKIEIDYRMY